MGWIMMSSQFDAEPAPVENKQDIPDADLMRVLNWGVASYFPQGVEIPAVLADDGSVITPASVRAPTGQEVHRAITDAIYGEIKNQVEAYEKRVAALAAADQVQPIDLVPASPVVP